MGTGKGMRMCSSASPQTVGLFPMLAAGTTYSAQNASRPPVPGTENTKGEHSQLSVSDCAKHAEHIQCHSDWQYNSDCPLGRVVMMVTGKVNAESACPLRKRSSACFKKISLFLYVALIFFFSVLDTK